MSVSYSSLVLKFPEFITADADEQTRITSFITDASLEVNATAWGTKRDLGISYLAAHRLAMANRTLASGTAGLTGAPGNGAIYAITLAILRLTVGLYCWSAMTYLNGYWVMRNSSLPVA